MCCEIFKTVESSFHPFVCTKRQTQSHPLGQIDYMFESFWELWLSAECAWAVWNRLMAFLEGTKVSLKFLGVLCNASYWQV